MSRRTAAPSTKRSISWSATGRPARNAAAIETAPAGSTPTIRVLSRIEREFEASDQRRYFVPCPHCGAMQWLKFDRLRWQKGRPETAEYHCEGCETPIAEHHKTAMLEAGEWRATTTAADPTTVGYHLSALYSPIGWLSWERIVRAWDAAQGSDEAIKAFRNTILGETWVETGEAPDWQRLYDRREAWKPGRRRRPPPRLRASAASFWPRRARWPSAWPSPAPR